MIRLLPHLAIVMSLASFGSADALVGYQGLLSDDLDAPLDGVVDLVFSVHDDEVAGATLWTETHLDVPVSAGVFSVLLGSATPVDPGLFEDPDLWLQVEVDGEPLSPRQRVGAVAFALRSGCHPGDFRGCYSGAPATLDVGPCAPGRRTCDAGGRWGDCVGQTVPLAEICGNGMDEDCDGAPDDGCVGLPDGADCSLSGECQSLHCQNGFCCAGGDCCAADIDCPAGYAQPSTCNSPGGCQGTRLDAACVASVCGSAMTDDDSGCSGIEADSCGPYPSVFCTGAPEQSPPVCASSCVFDRDCDPGLVCQAGSCTAP